MELRYSIKKLYEKPVFVFFSLIQIVVSILLVYKLFLIYDDLSFSKNLINGMLNEKNYYKNTEYVYIDDTEVQYDKILPLINKLENNKDFLTMVCNKTALLISRDDLLDESISDYNGYKFDNKDYMYANAYMMNMNYLNKLDLKFKVGSSDKFKYSYDEVPVILGGGYFGRYNVGDKIIQYTAADDGEAVPQTLVVIGILDKGMYTTECDEFKGVYLLDYSFIMPYGFKEKNSDSIGSIENAVKLVEVNNYLRSCFFQAKDITKVEKLLNEYNINTKFETIDKVIDNIGAEEKENLTITFMLCVLIIVFTVISISIVMLKSFKKDFKEYGVHLLVGASHKSIVNRVLGEVVLLFLIATVVSVFVALLINIKQKVFTFKLMTIIYTTIIFAIIVNVVCVIIKRFINKYSINEIIRRG